MSSVIIFHQIKKSFLCCRGLYCNRSQKTSKCGKNIGDKQGYVLCANFLFLSHFDAICDLSLEVYVIYFYISHVILFFNCNTYAWKSWRKGEKSVLAKLDNELMLLFSRCLITNKIPMSAQNLKSNLNVAINICLEQEWRLLRTWAWTWCGLESWNCYRNKVHQDHEFTQEWRSGQRQPWTCLNKHKILAKVTAQVQRGSLCWNEILKKRS